MNREARAGRAKSRGTWWFVVGLVAVAGCATTPGRVSKEASDAEKARIVARASKERWDLIIAGKQDEAYDYLSTGTRQLYSRDAFVASMKRFAYRDAQVEKAECEKDLCKVTVRLTYDHPMAKRLVTPLEENWVVENGRIAMVWAQ